MSQRKVTFYDILVYIAYGYFFLLGAAWFVIRLMSFGFDLWPFAIMMVFLVQGYFRHKLTDLILGILSLMFSFFIFLQSVEIASRQKYNAFGISTMAISAFAIIMSLIIAFSYVKQPKIEE